MSTDLEISRMPFATIAACIVTGVLLTACSNPVCQDYEIQRTLSPAGEFEAVVSQANCGALGSGQPIVVEIVKPGGQIGTGESVASILTTRSCPGNGPAVSAEWDAELLQLTVNYHSDSDAWTKTRYRNIMMKFRHCDVTYLDDQVGPDR